MATTQTPPSNLKERIAALQQCNTPPSPTPPPSSTPSRDASLTPPRGSLRDKIAKFERKGGVPIPRGSFGMGVPPPDEAGSTKSRELYGNRVAALGKGRPTAPGNAAQRAVTSPAAPLASPTSRTFPDDTAAKSEPRLTPNSINHSVSPSTSQSRQRASRITDRPVPSLDVPGGSDEAHKPSVEFTASTQLVSPSETQVAKPSETSTTTIIKPAVSTGRRPLSVSSSPSSIGLAVASLSRSDISSTPLRPTSPEVTPTQGGNLATPTIPEPSPTLAESHTQEHPPVVTSIMSTVQPHISVEQVPDTGAAVNATSPGLRPDRPPQSGSVTVSLPTADESSVIQNANSLKGCPTSVTNTSIPDKIKSHLLPRNSPTTASSIAFPISSTASNSGDHDNSTSISPPRVSETGHRSFTAVVHRSDSDSRPGSRHSTTSKSSTVTPRLSSSSFKTGSDGGVVRSKRNFKHLGTVAADPSPNPGLGDLAALLQEAAWLERQLSDENTFSIVSSALGEEIQKADISAPSSAITAKAGQATTPPSGVANSTRTKGRGLILTSFTSAPSSHTSQSPIQSSPSTPSFQASHDTLPAPSKSARGRKYFSLRGALRGPRLSLSSELSSDDSAPVATPPSPSFDLAMQQATQGHGNDSMSIRSMFSIRSNKSGKSDSIPGSLRLSPRYGVARASSFAERLLNRASKTKSMLDDPDDVIPERSPTLPPIIPETPGSLLSISPNSASSKNDSPFDREIFDAFPNVPSEIPQRSVSYLFPVPPKTTASVEQDFRRSPNIGISTS